MTPRLLETAAIKGDLLAKTARGIVVRVPLPAWRTGARRRPVVVSVARDTEPPEIVRELRALADLIERA